MKTYERNMADTALVVKSLTVLDKIDGGGLKEIRNSVESVKRQTAAQAKQQEQYWKSLSDDGVISVIEKQTLYRETQNIARSYSAITQQAASLQITAALLADYNATYNALHNYLYTTLKVFDDMSSETVIDDRNTFNTYFSNYYFEENFVLIAITAGILDTLEFRVLESLTEPGEEGETAIYQGGLYQYVNGAWKSVTTGAYKGPRTELPGGEEGAFFIVSESFTLTEGLIINGEELYVNGEALGITHTYIKGLIYYCQDGVWIPENDKTNWRYAAAFADVINITGELPQIFQDAIDDLQEQIDSNVQSLEEEIATKQGQYTIISGDMVLIDDAIQDIVDRANGVEETLADQAEALRDQAAELEAQGEDVTDLLSRATALENQMAGKISHLPVYFGPQSTIPQNPQEGDYFLYSGSNNQKWIKSIIYRWKNNSWYETPNTSPYGLDPTNTEFRSYYMMALEDVLATNVAGTGFFSTVFAESFFSNDATLDSLATREIYLRQNGHIMSDKTTYSEQRNGVKIDAAGDIDANGNMHFGATSTHKIAIGVDLYNSQHQYTQDFNDYDVVIGGRTLIKSGTKIKGELEGATGTFSGMLNAKGLRIIGFEAGDVELLEIKYEIMGGTGGVVGTAYKCVGTGTFRCKLEYFDDSSIGPGTATYNLYVNSEKVWSDTKPQGEIIYTDTIDINVKFGDIIKLDGSGGGRVSFYYVKCKLCTNENNEIMSLLSTPYKLY